MQQNVSERPIGELLAELSQETVSLVRQEFELAKTEMASKVSDIGKAVSYIAIGGAISYAGFLALIAAAVYALSKALPLWLSALIIGAGVIITGLIFIGEGRSHFKRASLVPRRTINELKEDREWLKKQIKT